MCVCVCVSLLSQKTFKFSNVNWDYGGRMSYHRLNLDFLQFCDGIVCHFDPNAMNLEEFETVLTNLTLNQPILVLLNKNDLPKSGALEEVHKKIANKLQNRVWKLLTSKEMEDGLNWLTTQILAPVPATKVEPPKITTPGVKVVPPNSVISASA